jgi:hypothetical protein
MKKWIILFFVSVFVFGCASENDTIIFSVMGDIPRSDAEDILIQEQIKSHNEISESELMFHVGDIKSGKTPCDEKVYDKVAGYLIKLNIPTFIIPGDNEWNDCASPDSAWNYWEWYFLNFENNWHIDFEVKRQTDRNENFAFVKNKVLFIGINLVGGLIHDSTEWKIRHNLNAKWIDVQFDKFNENVNSVVIFAQANPDDKHVDFMTRFLVLAEQFNRPIVFIHGDGHEWIFEEKWLLPNITRIQVDKGGIAPPLQLVLNVNSGRIISYNRNQFDLNASVYLDKNLNNKLK